MATGEDGLRNGRAGNRRAMVRWWTRTGRVLLFAGQWRSSKLSTLRTSACGDMAMDDRRSSSTHVRQRPHVMFLDRVQTMSTAVH